MNRVVAEAASAGGLVASPGFSAPWGRALAGHRLAGVWCCRCTVPRRVHEPTTEKKEYAAPCAAASDAYRAPTLTSCWPPTARDLTALRAHISPARCLHRKSHAEVQIMFRLSRTTVLTLAFMLSVCAIDTLAQVAGGSTATVTANAPIYINPAVSPTPLRVAAPGTVLRVKGQEGDWLQVEFNDPQWGPRVGWVQSEFVRVSRPDLEPMDLSVRPPQPSEPTQRFDAAPRPAATYFRQHVVGRSGVTFGTETAMLAGVEFSGDVVSVMQIYGSFDWHQNVAPTYLQDVLDILNTVYDTRVEAEIPAFVGIGGLKIIGPPRVVRPYGMGGFGVGRLSGKILVEGSDITDLLDEMGYIDKDDINATKPLFEVGGGIVFSIGRAYIDVSYRFRKFLDVGEPFNVSGVYGGAGISF